MSRDRNDSFQFNTELKIAVVCSSNQNRSMEAHNFLSKKGFKVSSFGSGNQVKLPGPAPDKPNIYDFTTTYEEMYRDLVLKDKNLFLENLKARSSQFPSGMVCDDLPEVTRVSTKAIINVPCYTQNGILHMLDRNRRIKPRPERFQGCKEHFEVIITCEERVYDQVLEDLENREKEDSEACHVINIDIQDNHEEATIGAFMICDLCTMLAESEDLDNDIDELILEFESQCQRPILHTVVFY